jgi:chemotaxis protein MotB
MARKKKVEEHVNHERWLVSYADFITLLFAFFTTLYAISTVDQKKVGRLMYSMRTAFKVDFFDGGPSGATRMVTVMEGLGTHDPDSIAAAASDHPAKLDSLAKRLGSLANDPLLKGKFQVRMESRGLVISLAEAGFFPSGSASLKPEAVAAVKLIEKTVADKDLRVTVEGHTDNIPVRSGKFASNWELSTGRASTVVAMFIEEGMDPVRLAASGYGEFKPVASNDTAEGRARNRRVDIVLSNATAEAPADDAAPKVTASTPSVTL